MPRGVWGSGFPDWSSAHTGEGFGEVIDQHPETPSVPSTCRRTKRTEIQSPGPKSRPKADRPEYGVRRLEVRRSKSERGKEIDSEYGVYRSTESEWR